MPSCARPARSHACVARRASSASRGPRRARACAAAAAAHAAATRVFVGDLSWELPLAEMTEAVRLACEDYGDVALVDLPKDKGSKKQQHRGFGFVEFADASAAAAAVEGLPGTDIAGRALRANYASAPPKAAADAAPKIPRTSGRRHVKLYFGNLKFSAESEDLLDLAAAYGKVVDAKVVRDMDGKSKGFGFVTMANATGAESATVELDGVFVPGVSHGGLTVNEFARIEPEVPDEELSETEKVVRDILDGARA